MLGAAVFDGVADRFLGDLVEVSGGGVVLDGHEPGATDGGTEVTRDRRPSWAVAIQPAELRVWATAELSRREMRSAVAASPELAAARFRFKTSLRQEMPASCWPRPSCKS